MIDGTAVTTVSRVTMRNRELIATRIVSGRMGFPGVAPPRDAGPTPWSDTLGADDLS